MMNTTLPMHQGTHITVTSEKQLKDIAAHEKHGYINSVVGHTTRKSFKTLRRDRAKHSGKSKNTIP